MLTANKISNNPSSVWEETKLHLKKHLGQATFNSWIKPLAFCGFENGLLKLSAPTKFMAVWVFSNYASKIKLLNDSVKQIEIEVGAQVNLTSPTRAVDAETPKVINFADYKEQIGSRIDVKYTFENFVSDKSNELALAVTKKIAEGSETPGINPLFLHSGVGLGKTHLMHAVANFVTAAKQNRKVIYLSAEKFLLNYIRSLKDRSTLQFKEELRSADILMIDDFQFIAGKVSTQEEFFHTVSSLVESGKQLIISCDRTPVQFENLPERMRSRLTSGLVVDIDAADYNLRLQILKSKAHNFGIEISDEILEFLAANITTNIRELEGALNRIVARATLVNSTINLDNIKIWIADLLKIREKIVTIEHIQDIVAAKYNLKTSELLSSSRNKNIARARQVAMFIAKNLTTKSLIDIGKLFGGRDHTTVIHSCRKIEELVSNNNELAAEIEFLIKQTKSN